MWTIHDFPGYGIVSRCQHQGYKACPPCGFNIVVQWSKESGKAVFEGNRRWLQKTHPYQMHPNAQHFNGKDEMQTRPHAMTIERLRWVRRTENWVAAGNSLGAKGCPLGTNGMKRECALFDLPYWEVSILIQLISSKLSEKYCLL